MAGAKKSAARKSKARKSSARKSSARKSPIVKKMEVMPEEWGVYCLTLIPGVSKSIAEVILKEYNSLSNLKKEYTGYAGKDVAIIRNLKHGAAKRRIGEKLEVKVRDYVMTI